ncbi:uncharacterized protein LOC118646908, partial [Monomorium pharaonis]|uniref:uncharacterized protein LOC118646908 n=1 Tax=Monomorium pharaonis TaxID=307658 RepID=UPI00174741FF
KNLRCPALGELPLNHVSGEIEPTSINNDNNDAFNAPNEVETTTINNEKNNGFSLVNNVSDEIEPSAINNDNDYDDILTIQIGCGRATCDTAAEEEKKEEEGEVEIKQLGERKNMQHVQDSDEASESTSFNILRENRHYFQRFDTHGHEITFVVRQPPEGFNPLRWLDKVFAEVHAYLTNSSNPDDYIGVTFTADTLAHGPVWLSFTIMYEILEI